jgi:hypothetical protein
MTRLLCLDDSGASSQSSDAASRRGMYSHFAGAADIAQTNIGKPVSKLELGGSVDALGSPRILLRPSPLDTDTGWCTALLGIVTVAPDDMGKCNSVSRERKGLVGRAQWTPSVVVQRRQGTQVLQINFTYLPTSRKRVEIHHHIPLRDQPCQIFLQKKRSRRAWSLERLYITRNLSYVEWWMLIVGLACA